MIISQIILHLYILLFRNYLELINIKKNNSHFRIFNKEKKLLIKLFEI